MIKNDKFRDVLKSSFSSLNKFEKINFVAEKSFAIENEFKTKIESFWHRDESLQKTFDQFSENTLTNYYLPYGVIPNVLIDDKFYFVPMVTEESSVVAAASKSAKFWSTRGGIKTEVISTLKVGQVHFCFEGDSLTLQSLFNKNEENLFKAVKDINENMRKRGGGIQDIALVDKTALLDNYYQLFVRFDTCDAMGANFINTVLERLADKFSEISKNSDLDIDIIMSIVSNYNPECIVRASVSCNLRELDSASDNLDAFQFANRFKKAIEISQIDKYRAVTNNKGIFNGVDAVALATGNDFRALESSGHAYASKDGVYRGLSKVGFVDGKFNFLLEIPLALGTVGGLTELHPMAKESLKMLGLPDAKKLMGVCAAIGLMQNFAAVRSLITTGIQKGHMKMHLMNILNSLEASEEEMEKAKKYFLKEVISFSSVRDYINSIRKYH